MGWFAASVTAYRTSTGQTPQHAITWHLLRKRQSSRFGSKAIANSTSAIINYDLPIPGDMLEQLENTSVELKVTLSYFIDPNPGLSANIDPQRYQSHGLRFDLQRKNETLARFKKRVNASEREDPKRAEKNGAPADQRWMLGGDSI